MTGSRLRGRVAVVTGGANGIGEATVRRMAQAGAAVVVADVDATAGAAVVEGVERGGGRAIFVATDVASGSSVDRLMTTAVATFGRIDVLHNNAGVHESGATDRTTACDLPEEVFDRVLAINLKGTWLCSRAAAPHLAAAGGGAIVNAASMSAHFGQPRASAYGPSKAAVVNLTQVLAQELAPAGTRVNCYSPGNVDTEMLRGYAGTQRGVDHAVERWHLAPRLLRADEVAEVVVFLASDASSGITGTCVRVDLGATAWRDSRPDVEL